MRDALRDLYEQLDEAQDRGFYATAKRIEAEIETLELNDYGATFYDDHTRFDLHQNEDEQEGQP